MNQALLPAVEAGEGLQEVVAHGLVLLPAADPATKGSPWAVMKVLLNQLMSIALSARKKGLFAS